MKSLSAVSIRQYERAVHALRQYSRAIELGLSVVLRHRPLLAREVAATGPSIVLVFGSDHGLCGRFNQQIVDFALARLSRETVRDPATRWLTVGARAAARLEAVGVAVDETHFLPGSVSGLTGSAQDILLKLDEWRASEATARVLVFHNLNSKEAAATPRMVQLLPLDAHWLGDLQIRRWRGRSLPTFTMEAEALFSALVRQHLFVTLYRAGAESMASEHATRLATMQAAERNIRDHLEDMNTAYRQRRQQSITEELLDVVSGFEVLQGPD